MSAVETAWHVFAKEMLDAWRDRRTLLVVLVTGVLMGPLILVGVSFFVASFEARADLREVYVVGIDQAPALKNYLERQTWRVKTPPEDFEAQLRSSKFGNPVIVVPTNFEADMLRGEAPALEIVGDSANKQSGAAMGALRGLLEGYNRERAGLTLALRGVAPASLESLRVEERDLASTQTRAVRITGVLPIFVMMAVVYGALNAALDSTAGERERGSLEPLVMNPASGWSLVLGKWGAVATVGVAIALLNCVSFLPAQWLLKSDVLQAMFQFGPREVLLFLILLLPFAAALSAVLMAVAIRCKTFKEAQANTTVVVLMVSLMPLFTSFNLEGEARWHLWVPALAQNLLMTRVLKGESFSPEQVIVPLLVCVALTLVGLWFVAGKLRSAALR